MDLTTVTYLNVSEAKPAEGDSSSSDSGSGSVDDGGGGSGDGSADGSSDVGVTVVSTPPTSAYRYWRLSSVSAECCEYLKVGRHGCHLTSHMDEM